MSHADTAICKALDRLHQELAGIRAPCRWAYNGGKDLYSCPHLALDGKTVIGAVNGSAERQKR